MVGQEILHYKITEKLGEGGMGVVYLAEDTKLKRKVAIKFLPEHIAANSNERKRFEIEAQAAAALSHPNIATIFNIEEADNELFIVMEFIDGQELKDRIDAGPLTVDESIDIATQIGKGLQAAHKNSVVHRDIKSSNIMLKEDGQVKIMDFGLAKIRGGIQVTKVGTILGTAAYMSPEQTSGEKLDHRTDIWSLGVLLYEMLIGQLPFKGDYDQAITYSILNEEQEPITGLRTGIPMEMERIVNKCLQKDPSDRYQHVDEFIVDLRQLKKESETIKLTSKTGMKRTLPQKQKRSYVLPSIIAIAIVLLVVSYFLSRDGSKIKERIPLAVADFVNETDEPELNSLSGMLITALEKSRRLSVLTRSRVFDILRQIGKENVDRIDENIGLEICRKLNIHVLAIGTIRKFGKNYSIDLKIIDPIKNEYLFTTSEQAESQEEIPLTLDKISDKTREGLQEKETELIQINQKVNVVTTTNLEAYQHYFKGKEYLDRGRLRNAEEELKKAVQLDSTFGLAIYQLAVAIYRRRIALEVIKDLLNKAMGLIESIPEREQYLLRARYEAINDRYTDAISILLEMEKDYRDDKEMCTMLARYAFQEGNYQLAQKYFEKVIRLDPEYELAWNFWDGSLPATYILTGELEEGLAKLMELKKQFPGVIIIRRNIADFYTYLDRYESAEQEYESILDSDQPIKSRIDNLNHKAFFLPYRGKYMESIKAFDTCIDLARQAGDSSAMASMLVFKSILYVWGWNDIEKAKKAGQTAEQYIKHLNYDLTPPLLYFYQQNYKKAGRYFFIKPLVFGKQGICDSLETAVSSYPENDQLKILLLFHLAECQFHNNRLDDAIESLRRLQKIYSNVAGFRAAYYPRSYYMLGKIYEIKGENNLAIENYDKFLKLWKDADKDLSDLIDAKDRRSELKRVF
jgi:serine/threonine protein kinase/Tfp pilus assembly protein PilF